MSAVHCSFASSNSIRNRYPHSFPACAARGVELKWFGGAEPQGFTSRYDSWRYIDDLQPLPQTLEILATTFDLRIPLTFSEEDMDIIGSIIAEEATGLPG